MPEVVIAMEERGRGGGGGRRRSSCEEEEEVEAMSVRLQPFVHQVGGSSSLLCFDDTTLCKPLIEREHRFYETMPEEMLAFVPEYRGVVQVSVEEDTEGYVSLIAHPCRQTLEKHGLLSADIPTSDTSLDSTHSDSDPESGPSLSEEQKNRLAIGGSTPQSLTSIHNIDYALKVKPDNHAKSQDQKPQSRLKEMHLAGYHSSWVVHCLRRQLAKMKKKNCDHSNSRHNFMLLENVATHFEQPCVLDLKMGKRTYGPDHSEEKKQMFKERCRNTTSARLGLRICGMQVFQADTGQYIFHNKYVGRTLTEKGVVEELYQYLHNGCRLRTDLIEHVVQKLEDLHDVLSQQDSFRFYSSSLLVMYEGADADSPESSHQHKKTASQFSGPYHEPESDEDRSDSGSEKSEHEEDDCENDSEDHDKMEFEEDDTSRDSTDVPIASGSRAFSEHAHTDSRVNGTSHSLVEVRMIDFAHSTHQSLGLGDEGVHSGPDLGYMFGLESLIRLFKEIAACHLRTTTS